MRQHDWIHCKFVMSQSSAVRRKLDEVNVEARSLPCAVALRQMREVVHEGKVEASAEERRYWAGEWWREGPQLEGATKFDHYMTYEHVEAIARYSREDFY